MKNFILNHVLSTFCKVMLLFLCVGLVGCGSAISRHFMLSDNQEKYDEDSGHFVPREKGDKMAHENRYGWWGRPIYPGVLFDVNMDGLGQLMIFDVPLSFVVDTIFLPVDLLIYKDRY